MAKKGELILSLLLLFLFVRSSGCDVYVRLNGRKISDNEDKMKLTFMPYSQVPYHLGSSHLHGLDGLLPNNDAASSEPPSKYAEI